MKEDAAVQLASDQAKMEIANTALFEREMSRHLYVDVLLVPRLHLNDVPSSDKRLYRSLHWVSPSRSIRVSMPLSQTLWIAR